MLRDMAKDDGGDEAKKGNGSKLSGWRKLFSKQSA
jgi:hypothetical protein